MGKEIISLDIGFHSIKLVGLNVTSRGLILTHLGAKEIPSGSEREDPGFISEMVKALFREVGLRPGKVNLTVPGPGIQIRQLTVPSMPKAELRKAVRWEIKSSLPFPIESVQIDFHILDEFVEAGVKKLNLIAAACPNEQIDRILSIAKGAGLKPIHLGVGPFAFWNLLLTLNLLQKEQTLALIDLGAEKTGFHIFKEGRLRFSREVTPAGTDLTQAVMEGVGSEEEPSLLYGRAENIKKEVGIPFETDKGKTIDPSIDLSRISVRLRPVLERLVAEIRRSLDYYVNQFDPEGIGKVLLTGGGSNLIDIDIHLAKELRLPVERFNPVHKGLYDPDRIDPMAADQTGPLFSIAIGAGVPKAKKIEFLPVKKPLWATVPKGKWIPRLAFSFTLLVFLLIFAVMSARVSDLQKRLDEKMLKVKALETLQARLTLLREKESRMKQDLSLFPSSVTSPLPFQEILRTIGHAVPNNITLTLLSVQDRESMPRKDSRPGKAQEGKVEENAGRELRMMGLAFGSDSECLTALAKIIERLERSPLFKNARLISADENKVFNRPGTGFEIVGDIDLNKTPPVRPGGQERKDRGSRQDSGS
jgi:type IV pilus assembly protein PilM